MTDFTFLRPLFTAFEARGYKLYLVGGCVRDAMLDIPVKDFDLCTDALPAVTHEIMAALGANVIEKNGGNYGTVHSIFADEDVEVTTFRQDKDYPAGDRRPVVEFSTNLEDDLMRRDFTINAMAATLNTHPNGLSVVSDGRGYHDLTDRKMLRSPQDARKLMSDDPLRILRAYRFAHRFGLTIDHDLRMAMRQFATHLRFVSRERIQVEMVKIAGGNQPEEAFREMMEDGVLHHLWPELSVQVGFDQQNPHHHLPLWEHTLDVVKHTKASGGNARSVLTALLHDVAKPHQFQLAYTCNKCGGKLRVNHGKLYVEAVDCDCLAAEGLHSMTTFVKKQFLGHDTLGAEMARSMMNRLKFSNDDVSAVALMIDLHQMDLRAAPNPKVVRRFANKVGDLAAEFIAFLKGDRLGHAPGEYSTIDYLEALEEGLKTMDLQEMVAPKLPINGNEVMEVLKISAGPTLGKVMKTIKQAVIDGDVVTREDALRLLGELKGPRV
jgi:poly(A) polymerase